MPLNLFPTPKLTTCFRYDESRDLKHTLVGIHAVAELLVVLRVVVEVVAFARVEVVPVVGPGIVQLGRAVASAEEADALLVAAPPVLPVGTIGLGRVYAGVIRDAERLGAARAIAALVDDDAGREAAVDEGGRDEESFGVMHFRNWSSENVGLFEVGLEV